ncbi:MAG TPA: hypothetical protein VNG89_12460, partial [Vicinamibacterales bacterium]|nr:hypothetical protein [Vicinamibacterales bacterium]
MRIDRVEKRRRLQILRVANSGQTATPVLARPRHITRASTFESRTTLFSHLGRAHPARVQRDTPMRERERSLDLDPRVRRLREQQRVRRRLLRIERLAVLIHRHELDVFRLGA